MNIIQHYFSLFRASGQVRCTKVCVCGGKGHRMEKRMKTLKIGDILGRKAMNLVNIILVEKSLLKATKNTLYNTIIKSDARLLDKIVSAADAQEYIISGGVYLESQNFYRSELIEYER